MNIDLNILNHIKQGTCVIEDSNVLRVGTWKERIIQCINPWKASAQIQRLGEIFIVQLTQTNPPEYNKELVEAATVLLKGIKRSSQVYKRLENTLFAHKCHQTLSLPVRKLVHLDGSISSPLLGILKSNFLHYGITKAHSQEKETAILFNDDEVYIRTKEGESFLTHPDRIALLLASMPRQHLDRLPLKLLRRELLKNEPSQERIQELQSQITRGHYHYTPLNAVPVDKKGVLTSHAYLAKGLEEHHVSHWSDVKTTFTEEMREPTYKFRVITRLPEYSFTKTWPAFFITVFRNILNFRAHGHSWIELVKPLHSQSNQFLERGNVTDIGYYFHPMNSRKRFQNADPMSYMPIPKNQLVVDETEISQESFQKGILYLNEVQAMLRKPNRKLNDEPLGVNLEQSDIDKIKMIYKMTLKSTCLGFANSMRQALTGIEADCRGGTMSWLLPKSFYKVIDRADVLIDQTYVLKQLARPFNFLSRMELPYYWSKKAKTE